MTPDVLLFALVDALLEHAVSEMWERRHDALVDFEAEDWIGRLGQWRALWWGTR